MSRHVWNSWKKWGGSFSPLRFQKCYHIRHNLRGCDQSCDTRLYERFKKCTSPKRAAHRTTWRVNITCNISFNILHTKEMFFNIMYVCSPQHRAMRLLSRRYDLTNTGYKVLEIIFFSYCYHTYIVNERWKNDYIHYNTSVNKSPV